MAYNTGNVFDAIGAAFFGDASDGNLIFDGSATVLGIAPSISTYTLNRDIYANNMTVNTGVTVLSAGYRVYVRGKLLVNSGGAISCNGASANGPGAGVGYSNAGSLYVTSLSGMAGVAANGSSQNGLNNSANSGAAIGGTGGKGGNVTGGTGGTGSSQTSNPNFSFGNVVTMTTGKVFLGAYTSPPGGGGGGSGAISGTTGSSGAGGAGGGAVLVCAFTLDNRGTISANGGNGGNATGSPSAAGGGGGGIGGMVLVSYRNLASIGTITANGGTPGTGVSESAAGTAGSSGRVVTMRI